jgi:hypothetical protein
MSADLLVTFLWYVQKILCVVPIHCNTTVNTSSHIGEYSDGNFFFARISWQEFIISCCNTSKSLIGALQVSPEPEIQSIKVRRSCGPVDWASASYPLLIESLVRAQSGNGEKTSWCPIMYEPHVLTLKERHMFQDNGKSFNKNKKKTTAERICSSVR